jgi:hypothetical protein
MNFKFGFVTGSLPLRAKSPLVLENYLIMA